MKPSPRHFKHRMPPPPNYPPYYQIGMLPMSSSYFESTYPGENQLPIPFDGAPYEEPQNLYHSWHVPHIEYIKDILPSDVLSGRGGATNSHSGNRAFRSLVKQYQGDYLKAKKRDKPDVAAVVVQKIREKGGRFLRRAKNIKSNEVVWVEVGDERAKEKTCQALREGAPEIRRRKKVTNFLDDGDKGKGSDGSISGASTFGRMEIEDDTKPPAVRRTQILRTNFETEKKEADSIAVNPMVIRPSMALLCGDPSDKPLTIPIDHLDEGQREVYLRDFLPPNPSIQKKKMMFKPIVASATAEADNETGTAEMMGEVHHV
eukprot:CAMPEP_0116142776 /NCGR_PEP_ID=MMETSP0329-20121206/15089_1 /TAXON_ID=697910 /ORGANISM="Pseudo-nitzschia arenysensis, Strain B593" /LENGTH=316 /DNA_ID=CAMNT_0003638035 /DNA_START=308 /DNA_END=1258 /DNA_ORIENTATION=+